LAFNLARPQDAGGYGIAGLALAQSLVAVSEVLILFSVMLFHDHKLFNREFWGGGLRILSVTGFSILTAFIMISLLPLRLTDTGLITLGSKLSVIALVTILVHVSVSAIFGLEEVSPVWRKFRQLVLKPIRIQ
jgi:hypothetical protein